MNEQYNAIDYAQQLEAAGVPKAQAQVHAQTLGLVLSRCLDAEAETKLRAEMQVGEAKMLNRFDLLESSLRADMNVLKWMNGLTLALVVGLYVRSWLA